MSQIITVKTEIKNFASLEKACKNLKYTISGARPHLTVCGTRQNFSANLIEENGKFSVKIDSDYQKNVVETILNEYAKEEALAWAKFHGKTVQKISGNAEKGYDIEIPA